MSDFSPIPVYKLLKVRPTIKRSHSVDKSSDQKDILHRFSILNKVIWSLAYCNRFVHRSKKRSTEILTPLHIWGVAIKSANKNRLKHIIGTQILTLENIHTLVTHIEGILNSRSLILLSSNRCYLCALTPDNFLISHHIICAC